MIYILIHQYHLIKFHSMNYLMTGTEKSTKDFRLLMLLKCTKNVLIVVRSKLLTNFK